jgi:hypothetical protein
MDESAPSVVSGSGAFRVHAPPHWLQAVPPLTTKFSFPAQIRRCQVLDFATRVKGMINIKDDADGMAQLIDAEGETLVLECGLLGKFRKMDGAEPITQVVLFTTHPTHYLIARRHSGMREASENGFDVLCFSSSLLKNPKI